MMLFMTWFKKFLIFSHFFSKIIKKWKEIEKLKSRTEKGLKKQVEIYIYEDIWQ